MLVPEEEDGAGRKKPAREERGTGGSAVQLRETCGIEMCRTTAPWLSLAASASLPHAVKTESPRAHGPWRDPTRAAPPACPPPPPPCSHPPQTKVPVMPHEIQGPILHPAKSQEPWCAWRGSLPPTPSSFQPMSQRQGVGKDPRASPALPSLHPPTLAGCLNPQRNP